MTRAMHVNGRHLPVARATAWSVLLVGWVGVGSVVQAFASGPRSALALMLLWLLALSAGTAALSRWRPSAARLRALAPGVALLIVGALVARPHIGAALAAMGLVAGWAALAVLASTVVRACRDGRRASAASLASAALVGALVAWAWLGDIGDLVALQLRLLVGAVIACALLAALVPRHAVHAGPCRAALFDCAMSAWPGELRWQPGRWPLMLASLSMLPMMLGLPLMLGLCSSDAVGPRLALALHLAAMFAPAWLLTLWRWRWSGVGATGASAVLLALGVWSLVSLSGTAAWWSVAATHGMAWSVAWAARLVETTAPRAHRDLALAPATGVVAVQ